MKKLGIIGSGDLAQQLRILAKYTNEFDVVGCFDDFRQKGEVIHGMAVLGHIKDVQSLFGEGVVDEVVMAVGYKHMSFREKLFEKLSPIVPFATLVHPSSYIDPSVRLGKGVVIYAGCVIDSNSHVLDNVLLNVGCHIAHDTIIREHCFLSPSVKLAGYVNIKSKVNLGIGTIVIDNICIGGSIKTGGGTVVIENLEKKGLYVGNPARFIR